MMTDQLKILLEHYNDEEYFFLARNYLGLIETPFHKEHITANLVGFFSLEENQKRIIELLDPFDQTIITALLFIGPVRFEDLATLLSGIYPYGELLLRLANLRERLIVIATNKTLIINPLLEQRFTEIASLTPLFGILKAEETTHPFSYREFLQGVLTLAERPSRSFFRKEYEQLFPTIPRADLQQIFEMIHISFERLGIIIEDHQRRVNWSRALQLFSMNDSQIQAAMLGVHLEGNEDAALNTCCYDLILFLEEVKALSKAGLQRLGQALSLKHHTKMCDLIPILLGLGFLTKNSTGYHRVTYTHQEPASSFVVDSDYSVSYLGSIDPDSLLVRFATLEVLDQTRLWRITEERLRTALDGGISFDEIKHYIQKYVHGTVNPALLKSLDLIAERSNQAQIYDGLTLHTDERVSRLVEQLPALQEHILQRLTPTVFLMSRSHERVWRQALKQAGIILGATKGELADSSVADHREFPPIQWPKDQLPVKSLNQLVELPDFELDERLKEAILKKKYAKAEETDLLERFEERLIINSSQLAAQVLYTRIEAGGFDYQGKISLAKQASSKEGTIVQLFMGSEEVMALAMELTYTPTKEALFKVAILPQMETRVIPLSKIFLLRQIKMLFL